MKILNQRKSLIHFVKTDENTEIYEKPIVWLACLYSGWDLLDFVDEI
jgi:hypothetical protein